MESRHNNYIRNLIGFTMVNILWQLGTTLVHPETSLIYLLKEVNASNLAISAVVPVFMFFNLVPCVFWGGIIHINKNMKKVLYISCILVIIPYLIIYFIMGWMQGSNPYFVRILFLLLIVSNLALSLESVAYQNYVSYVVPENKRGTLWGIVFSFGYVLSLAAYPVMNLLNDRLTIYEYYQAGFLIFFIFALLATQCFLFIKEPKEELQENSVKINWKEYFSSCKEIISKDKNFTGYLLIEYFANFSICITTFSLVYIINSFKIPNEDTIKFTIIYCLAFGIGNYAGGKLGDQRGFYFVKKLSMVIDIIFTLLLILNDRKIYAFIIYALIVFGLALQEAADINIPIESTRSINKSKYIGISKTVTAPSLLISLVLGRLVDIGVLSVYMVLCISIGCLTIGCILNIFFVRGPRKID